MHYYHSLEDFRLNIKFSEASFSLIAIEKANSWQTTVDESNLRLQAEELDLAFDEYYTTLKEYLINMPANVKLSIKGNTFSIHSNKIVKYFACTLNKVDYFDCISGLLAEFYHEKCEYKSQFEQTSSEYQRVLKDKTEYEGKLNEFISRKQSDDNAILSSFTLILNEKKHRIQHLNELLAASKLPNNNNHKRQAFKAVKAKKKPIKEEAVSSNSSSASPEHPESDADSYNTEDELTTNEPRPSTSSNLDLDVLDDLLMDSPPKLHHLPKRLKSDNSNNAAGFSLMETQPTGKEMHENHTKKEINCNVTSYSKLASPELSTQEMFDRF